MAANTSNEPETPDENIQGSGVNQIRLKYKYRRLIMRGKVSLPYKAAAQMVGPDCAYHLYGTVAVEKKPR